MSGRRKRPGIRAIFLTSLLLGGCCSATATSDTLQIPPKVQRVGVFVGGTITLVVSGYLPDGCGQIAGIEQTRNGSLFLVSIMTTRPADMMCTAAIREFERYIRLDVRGLPSGRYMVDVNGIQQQFDLPSPSQ